MLSSIFKALFFVSLKHYIWTFNSSSRYFVKEPCFPIIKLIESSFTTNLQQDFMLSFAIGAATFSMLSTFAESLSKA